MTARPVDWKRELRLLMEDMTTPALLALVKIEDGNHEGSAAEFAHATLSAINDTIRNREPRVTDEEWLRREDMVLAELQTEELTHGR